MLQSLTSYMYLHTSVWDGHNLPHEEKVCRGLPKVLSFTSFSVFVEINWTFKSSINSCKPSFLLYQMQIRSWLYIVFWTKSSIFLEQSKCSCNFFWTHKIKFNNIIKNFLFLAMRNALFPCFPQFYYWPWVFFFE